MMIAALFALAFTLAMGQAGMLSFGHAAYYGLGAFAALHLMRAVEQKLFGFPTPLIPLAGAAGRLRVRTSRSVGSPRSAPASISRWSRWRWPSCCSRLRRPGTRCSAGSPAFPPCAGPSWGVSFGSRCPRLLSDARLVRGVGLVHVGVHARHRSARLALALRDNEQRVRFLGFNTHVARTLIFAISCLFAGVAGALLAIANEAANYTIFSAQASANVVLQTFIGGAGTFFGPALGAIIMTFFARVTSDLTRSWLLYQGLIFVLVMLFAPQGLGGLVALHARKVRAGGWKHLVAPYLLCLVVGLLLIAGLVFVVESIHVVLTDAYLAKRTAAKGEWVPYELFGRRSSRPRPRPGPSRSCCWRSAAAPAVARRITGGLARRHARRAGRSSRDASTEQQRSARERRHEHAALAPGGPVLELKALRKSFGETQIIRGVDLAVKRGRAPRADRAQRRRQVDAVQSHLGPLTRRPPARSCSTERIAGFAPHIINRLGLSRSFQITNVFPRMSVAENLRISIMGRHGHRFTLFRPIRSLTASTTRWRSISRSSGWRGGATVSPATSPTPSSVFSRWAWRSPPTRRC